MDDPKLPSHDSSSIPLIARLDHLEFVMKYLERKQRCGSNVVVTAAEKQYSESSIKEDYFKGTLMDRVACLENRLFQLCVEIDSSESSNPLSRASTIASGESSSSQGSKGEICYSFPTFNNVPNHNGDKEIMPQNHNNTLGLKEKSEIVKGQTKTTRSTNNQQVVVVGKKKGKKSEKKPKGEKKTVAPIGWPWPHLKINLGC